MGDSETTSDTVASNGRLTTCFQLGKWLGRLQGHLIRAVFCGRDDFFRTAIRAWESVEAELVTFDPLVLGESLRDRARDDRRSFERWYFDPDPQGFPELHHAALDAPRQSGIQTDNGATQSVVDALLNLVPKAPKEYEGELLRQLQSSPRAALALRLGRVVQEAVLPPGLERELVSCDVEHISDRKKRMRVTYNVSIHPRRLGEVPPDGAWYGEVQRFLRLLHLDARLDLNVAQHPGSLMGFAQKHTPSDLGPSDVTPEHCILASPSKSDDIGSRVEQSQVELAKLRPFLRFLAGTRRPIRNLGPPLARKKSGKTGIERAIALGSSARQSHVELAKLRPFLRLLADARRQLPNYCQLVHKKSGKTGIERAIVLGTRVVDSNDPHVKGIICWLSEDSLPNSIRCAYFVGVRRFRRSLARLQKSIVECLKEDDAKYETPIHRGASWPPHNGCHDRERELAIEGREVPTNANEPSLPGAIDKVGVSASEGTLVDECLPGEARPNVYLTSWGDILAALDLKKSDRDKVAKCNREYDGPIVIGGRGEQPKVEKDKLLEWWNGLGERFEELKQRRRDAEATVSEQYPHGKNATVVPEIRGTEKKRRGDKKQ